MHNSHLFQQQAAGGIKTNSNNWQASQEPAPATQQQMHRTNLHIGKNEMWQQQHFLSWNDCAKKRVFFVSHKPFYLVVCSQLCYERPKCHEEYANGQQLSVKESSNLQGDTKRTSHRKKWAKNSKFQVLLVSFCSFLCKSANIEVSFGRRELFLGMFSNDSPMLTMISKPKIPRMAPMIQLVHFPVSTM